MKEKIEEILIEFQDADILHEHAVNKILKFIEDNYVPKTNPYFLNNAEYQKMEELKSHTVKLEGGNGIGIGVDCLVKGKWVDITDYSSW